MAKNLTSEERIILRSILADPQAVTKWLDEMQYTACAGLIRFPELVEQATAHIFAGTNPLYVEVYHAANRGAKGLEAVFVTISRRKRSMECALPLAELASHPVSRGEAARTIARLQKFVAWQYRQELKARRPAA